MKPIDYLILLAANLYSYWEHWPAVNRTVVELWSLIFG